MHIDLKAAFAAAGTTEGVYHLSGGERGHTYALENGDGTFDLRYEHGWYATYLNDGVRPVAGVILHVDGTQDDVPGGGKRNIVAFEPMTGSEANARYPGIGAGFPP